MHIGVLDSVEFEKDWCPVENECEHILWGDPHSEKKIVIAVMRDFSIL